jgi:hypothetical protein
MVGTLLVKEQSDPELLGRFREEVILPRMAAAGAILRRGIERGELRPDLDPAVVAQVLAGSMFARHIAGQPADDTWYDHVFDTVWRGISAT